jgi:hypothetical protein
VSRNLVFVGHGGALFFNYANFGSLDAYVQPDSMGAAVSLGKT